MFGQKSLDISIYGRWPENVVYGFDQWFESSIEIHIGSILASSMDFIRFSVPITSESIPYPSQTTEDGQNSL